MALGVSEDHLELATSVRGYAERHGAPMPGLLGLHLPEESGGQGYGLGELAVALEELGRALVPGGFLPTVLASAVLHAGGVTGKLAAGLPDGSATAALALDAEMDAFEEPDGSFAVSGTASLVLGAPGADLVLVPVRPAEDTVWMAID